MDSSRRNFLKAAGASLFALPLLSGLTSFPEIALGADLPLAVPGKGMAGTLGYCAPADKKNKFCPNHPAGQICNGCQLFTKVKGSGKHEVGKCAIMPANFVSGQGWCKSWTKKFS